MNSLSAVALKEVSQQKLPLETTAPQEIRQRILVKKLLDICVRSCHKCRRHIWIPRLSFSSSRYICDSGTYLCSHCLDNILNDCKRALFNIIAAFVQDLNTSLGKQYKPVALYNRLIKRTTLMDEYAINRHIAAFKLFFQQNPNYITTKELTNGTVRYSDRIYLNIDNIIKCSTGNSHVFIHNYLIVIYDLLNWALEKN